MNNFNVSVIIPVLNGDKYIERAIESAILLDSVVEVIVIDDGSTDSSLDICKRLATLNSKIKVLTHKGNVHKGVSASRNLGIYNAQSPFIAFLDADDYYLPNRFDSEKQLFNKHIDFDGAYGATKIINTVTGRSELYTYSQIIPPELLFKALVWQNYGHFHISTLTIRKKTLIQAGMFDVKMPVAEDTELFFRIANIGRIYTGNISTPISIRTIHNDNTIIKHKSKYTIYNKYLYKKILKLFLFSTHTSFNNKNEIILMLNHHNILFSEVMNEKKFLIKLCITYPLLFICPFIYHKYFQLIRHK